MPTIRTQVTGTWSVVASGRTSGAVIIDIYENPCVFYIGTSAPNYTDANHYRSPGEHLSVTLDAGENLYARTPVVGQTALVVSTVTQGDIGQGIDERVYRGAELGITIQPFTEANAKNGTGFEASAQFTIAAGATNSTILKTGSKTVILKRRKITFDGSEVSASIRQGAAYTGGTAATVYNQNSISPAATTVQIIGGATISNTGTQIFATRYLFGLVPQGWQATGGVSSSVDGEYILQANTNYLFQLTNPTGSSEKVGSYLLWYEGPLSTES